MEHRQLGKWRMKNKRDLPYSVRHNRGSKKYQGEICFSGADEQIRLSEWDT